uniref:AsmA-like C-terminal region-containing protein n=1 Tax=Meridianimarinicoccus zhengii TaxID=2056810 RepID=UPI0013A6D546
AGPGRYRGQLRLAGLTLPPGGAAALRAGAATDAAAGDGMAFEDVRAEFTLGPDRIDLHSASATGASLGLAVDGRVNLRDRTLALQGVASPLYFLNRMGAFMTRRGEGLIGLHFTLTGPMDAPDLNANPLSVLTPGPLREMFRSGPNAATPPEDRE